MLPLSRRPLASLLAASLATAALIVPVSHIAAAAEPRVVVAGATSLPTSTTVIARGITANFDVALAQRDAPALSAFLASLTTPSSPHYHHFLTPAQFGARFGASASTIASVRAYLTSFGLRVRALNTGRTLLEMSGRSADIARAFATPVETVRLASGALRAQFARAATLPAPLARDVTAVAGLSSVVTAHSQLVTPHAAPRASSPAVALPGTCASAQPSATATPNSAGGYSVNQQAQLYGLSGAWAAGKTGQGQTIALYELGQYDSSNTAVFFKCYGLSPTMTTVNVDGGSPGGFNNEATMDVEEAAALAPGAALEIYQAPNTPTGNLDLYARIASDNTASVVSTSWGDCEIDPAGTVAAEQVIFEQMAAQGQTVVAASGDNGSSDCNGVVSNAPAVDDPASQPYVTGVGGLTVAATSPLSESVWNANGGAGGGGASKIWSRPAWQSAPGIPASATMRMVPDLSVMADPATGFMNYNTHNTSGSCQGWCPIGGTSIGAPLVSALIATGAQVCGVARLGFLNPTLYNIARTSGAFNDVTTGNNDLFGTGVYAAGVGYDMASGLGSPSTTFVNDLCPAPATAARSALVFATKQTVVATPSHFTVSLRDANGNRVVNAPVVVSAQGSSGRVIIDSDRSSVRNKGLALYTVASNQSGDASFTLESSLPGHITLTVKYNGGVLFNKTVVVHPLPLSQQKPLTPRITAVAARSHQIILSVAPRAANTPFVQALQVSIDGGATWHSYPAHSTRIVVMNLQGATAYVLRVRAANSNGYSPVSPPIRATALR
ncbi:MAG: hypothetical protein HIU57_04240 [Acidobacteria bacterium]|nr:hypothetical protein [Acidobacteriota bacterium]